MRIFPGIFQSFGELSLIRQWGRVLIVNLRVTGKRYVGELDENGLRHFLHFCTGAYLLFGSDITVNFIETSDFQCHPQANTCGCCLMLPVNYQNYPDLRSDFNAILNSSVWVIDIV